MAIYLQNQLKSKKDRNCLTSCHSVRNLLFKNVISDLFFQFHRTQMHVLHLVFDALMIFLFESLRICGAFVDQWKP